MTNPPIVVPEWQRNFRWTTSEVETFWEDLLTFNQLYPDETVRNQEYFLGSVVIVDNGTDHQLLDGQQRLATSAILLSVIRDFLSPYKQDAGTRISQRYLTDFDDALNMNTYKLSLNRYDRNFFRREILEPRAADYVPMEPQMGSHRLIRQARELFVDRFTKKYEEIANPETSHQWALRIQNVLTGHFSVVAIVSTDQDNAANVFETLNDRGIGLSTPDLLRNLILRGTQENHLDQVIDLWGEVLEIESETNINTFIRHYWISHKGDVKTQSLYRAIKNDVTTNHTDSLIFSRSLRDAALIYRDLVSAQHENEEISKLLRDIAEMGANVLYPAILSEFQKDNITNLQPLLKALISTFVRHNVIGGLENSQLETVLYGLAKSIRDGASVNDAIISLREFTPDDVRFGEAFGRATISRRQTARYVLRELELDERTTEELDVGPPNRVHVEHIYPQTPIAQNRWSNHSSAINRIGNLTLLSRRLNTTIRNAEFIEKKPYYDQSEILITKGLSIYDDWSMVQLETRQAVLAERASEIWSFPDIN